ncbi:hypothetical protein BKA80DRAFT_260672 [Phyllosticta citrichinensis]
MVATNLEKAMRCALLRHTGMPRGSPLRASRCAPRDARAKMQTSFLADHAVSVIVAVVNGSREERAARLVRDRDEGKDVGRGKGQGKGESVGKGRDANIFYGRVDTRDGRKRCLVIGDG